MVELNRDDCPDCGGYGYTHTQAEIPGMTYQHWNEETQAFETRPIMQTVKGPKCEACDGWGEESPTMPAREELEAVAKEVGIGRTTLEKLWREAKKDGREKPYSLSVHWRDKIAIEKARRAKAKADKKAARRREILTNPPKRKRKAKA